MGTLAHTPPPARRLKGPRCDVGVIISQLDDIDRVELEGWFADGTLKSTQITKRLQNGGHWVGAHTVARHRRGDCLCDAIEAGERVAS